MAEEDELTQEPEESAVEEKQPKKKLLMIVGAVVLLFILSSAGNYIYLKMTYEPPEPSFPTEEEPLTHQEVVEEEKRPILTIDLGEKEKDSTHIKEALVKVSADSIRKKVLADSIARMDSISTVIEELCADVKRGDSLRAITQSELAQVKKMLKANQVRVDSANYRQSLKLAKIVESMPAEDAAKMLESLSDAMVIDILMRLKQRQAAKIMAEFSASRSARLSEVILKPVVKG